MIFAYSLQPLRRRYILVVELWLCQQLDCLVGQDESEDAGEGRQAAEDVALQSAVETALGAVAAG